MNEVILHCNGRHFAASEDPYPSVQLFFGEKSMVTESDDHGEPAVAGSIGILTDLEKGEMQYRYNFVASRWRCPDPAYELCVRTEVQLSNQ
jgi:hypothetical protein